MRRWALVPATGILVASLGLPLEGLFPQPVGAVYPAVAGLLVLAMSLTRTARVRDGLIAMILGVAVFYVGVSVSILTMGPRLGLLWLLMFLGSIASMPLVAYRASSKQWTWRGAAAACGVYFGLCIATGAIAVARCGHSSLGSHALIGGGILGIAATLFWAADAKRNPLPRARVVARD